MNLPLPAGATGDVYLRALDDVVAPQVERFAPTWVLISAGFDAHRADPLTGLGLSAGDYAAIGERVAAWAEPGHLISFLEGGYNLDALRNSVAASLPTLIGAPAQPGRGGGPTPPAGPVRPSWKRSRTSGTAARQAEHDLGKRSSSGPRARRSMPKARRPALTTRS